MRRKEALAMKVTAVALVLIVGAAVVLWFGNMLNSWVLGGLIGGLAALLLSIPISLTIFSYFSHRHDERLRAEAQEEILAQVYGYEEDLVDGYEDHRHVIEAPRAWNGEVSPQRRSSRQLATPNYPPLPAAGQSYAYQSGNLPVQQRSVDYTPLSRQSPEVHRKEAARRPAANRGVYYPDSRTSSLRTQAVRAAQQEAAWQRDGANLPATTSRRMPAARPAQSLPEQPTRLSRQVPSRTTGHVQSQRAFDTTSPQTNTRRSFTSGDMSSLRPREPQTEQLNMRQSTGSVRQTQTGQIGRNPQLSAGSRNPDIVTGTLKTPLVRRAPYMYEDDPLRQELAQQINAPLVRRSSRRFENVQRDSEDER